MQTSGRHWGILFSLCGLAAGLSACKLHDQVQVSRHGDKLSFEDADSKAACLDGLEVSSRTDGTMWKLAADKSSKHCSANFPLVYGTVPNGMIESMPARQLRASTDYELRGTGSAHYFGAFMLLPKGLVANRWTEY